MTADGAGPMLPAGEPTVLRSLTSAVLLDRRGDIGLVREARGSPMEWGGVYAQHVRLTARWEVRIDLAGEVSDLGTTLAAVAVDGDHFRSTHRVGGLEVVQQIVPLASPPGALRTIQLRASPGEERPVTVTSHFVPFLLPVLVEGIRPVEYDLQTRAAELRLRQRGFGLSFRSSVPPSRLYVDRASWRGGRRRGPVHEVGSDHELRVPSAGTAEVRFAVVGGLERDLVRIAATASDPLPNPVLVAARSKQEEQAWVRATPRLRFPDAPDLERAYAQARAGLRRLYSRPGDGLTGLVAGYPWYSSIWCRDLAWMLPAVLWLGDVPWARASIGSVLGFQASSDLPLVAAEPGELPMQLSPGPIFLFGTSDTTLYYPGLLHRLVRHSGDARLPPASMAAVDRAIAWAERRTDPGTGLLRNGGEVAAVERAEAALARVRYGIDAPDTTIWDSTDRRDHAIDIQVLWLEALEAAAALDPSRASDGGRDRHRTLAERLRASIPTLFAWPEERYLCDSIRHGRPVRRVRPNALRAVSAGLLDAATAREVVRRAAEDDLTTPWGVRTLSARDPAYAPTAYHDGQVWTIATAWAADAAWAAGEPELGYAFLRTIVARLAAENGLANECYRGDRAEPFNSCFLLGFSVAPFLTVVFERLWGLSVDARRPELTVRPAFPAGWRSAEVAGLRVGTGIASVRWRPGRLEVDWHGDRPLHAVGPSGRTDIASGGTGTLAGP